MKSMAALFAKKKESEKKPVKASKKKESLELVGVAGRVLAASVIKSPVITEKAHLLSQSGSYSFFVDTQASKDVIRQAIEKLYDVHVVSVRTVTLQPTRRFFGRTPGYTKKSKKAFVRVRQGESIDIFGEGKQEK